MLFSRVHSVFKDHKFFAVWTLCTATGILMSNIFEWRFGKASWFRSRYPVLPFLDLLHNFKLDLIFPVLMPRFPRERLVRYPKLVLG